MGVDLNARRTGWIRSTVKELVIIWCGILLSILLLLVLLLVVVVIGFCLFFVCIFFAIGQHKLPENMYFSTIYSELLILLRPKLSLIIYHHRPGHLVRRFDFVFKVKVTAKVQNVNIC